jgi:putative colanic acid biosynthesis UDP-glucose lipid carrier transferase
MASPARRVLPHASLNDALYRLVDAGAILLGLVLVQTFTHWQPTARNELIGAAAVIAFLLIAEVTGVYRSWRGISTDREILCAWLTWSMTLVVLLSIGYIARYTHDIPRRSLVLWALSTPILIGAARILLRAIRRAFHRLNFGTQGFAIVGVNELALQLAKNVEGQTESGLKFLGFYDDRPEDRVGKLPQDLGHHLGTIQDLVDAARAGSVQAIYITFPMRAEDRIREVLDRLSDTTASVYIVPDFFVFELLHSRWTSIGGLPVVSIFENPFYGADGMLKRAFDFVAATLLLTVLAVPMACIALAIKLTSKGPVFFRQKRYGLDGQEIRVWKFRSMTVCENGPVIQQATKTDARITPLGGILRKTSLDELPQLFNVIEGTMSLVGPRPHASAHNEIYRQQIRGYMLRHKVKPGITGLAQVNGWRGETDTLEKMEKRIECDHQYIREWSLWLDLRILFKTAFVVFSRQNAY